MGKVRNAEIEREYGGAPNERNFTVGLLKL
jgi:hypothetical protein